MNNTKIFITLIDDKRYTRYTYIYMVIMSY